jgi:fibronectin type 3 domain-containing protein
MTGKASGSIASYRVYRSERDSARGAKANPYSIIAEVDEPSYADANFEFGQTYFYKVRAVVTANGVKAESQDSAPVEILPRDTFAPAVPAGVTGLYTSGAIELIWNPNQERDLAGYNIMRRENGGRPERLNLELLRSPLYHDKAVAPGHHYYYQVTAVDMSGNESAPSAEIEVDVP